LERKRYIGNDTVVIIFCDQEDPNFTIETITSRQNRKLSSELESEEGEGKKEKEKGRGAFFSSSYPSWLMYSCLFYCDVRR
jgi:hypothetical protein